MSVTSGLQAALANRGVPTTTAISLIVDRSGSMEPYVASVVESVSRFITEQQTVKGSATLSLSQFADVYEVVFHNKDIKEVNPGRFQYHPSGGTAFRDAIVQAVKDMEAQLKKLPAADKPKRVVLALITDGEDTQSVNSVEKVKKIIQEQEKLGWDFMLLGADGNTLNFAKELGISEKKTAVYAIDNPGEAIKLLSQKVTQARRGKEVKIEQQERLALLGKKEEL
jgi:uncharacterized protein YegL